MKKTQRNTKSRRLACALLILLAATCAVSAARTHIPTWLCENLPASHDPARHTIFFSKGIIAIGS